MAARSKGRSCRSTTSSGIRAHTRFTAFLDPGRVKSGILPNKQMGRALDAGRTVTLVISRDWRDEHGLPLKDEYRRVLKVGPPVKTPLDPRSWRIQPPSAGSRSALVVTFQQPLDHGLLMRALGVTRNGEPFAGDVTIGEGETRWMLHAARAMAGGAARSAGARHPRGRRGQSDRQSVRSRQLRHGRQEPQSAADSDSLRRRCGWC